ncbi:MAG: phytoene desaturase family protein, partial [Caldilineaceae bacterium]
SLVPEEYRRKLARTPVSISFVILSLVLDRDPATFGLEPMDAFFTDTADLKAMLAADDPEHAFFSVQFPEFRATDADAHRYALQVLAPASFDYGQRWGTERDGVRGAEYERLKADFAARLLKRSESRMPGLRNHIVQTDISTPITMQRYTRNDMGSPVGWSYTSTERWKQRVPFVDGLYLAGHWVGPSGIYNVATSGRNAAELIQKDRNGAH